MGNNISVLQEQDGAWSMRRLLALYYALLSGASLIIGALTGSMAGIYGCGVAALASLVLLGLTTVSDVVGIAKTVPKEQEIARVEGFMAEKVGRE